MSRACPARRIEKMTNTVFFEKVKCTVQFFKYPGGNTGIQLWNNGEPQARATITVPGIILNDNEVIIKDYSENKGMYAALLKAGIIEATDKTIELDYVTAPIARLITKTTGKNYKIPNPKMPMLDGPVDPYKSYGKVKNGRKTAKKPIRKLSPSGKAKRG
jgi:hypothetical protein